MTRDEWLALAERCEKATGPDRGLDALIFRALSGSKDHWHAVAGIHMTDANCPLITASIDAIKKITEKEFPGWAVSSSASVRYGCSAGLSQEAPYDAWEHTDMGGVDATGVTEALARCAAFCRAMAEKEGAK